MATTTRRTVLQTTAAATTLLATPFVRGAHGAGKLSVGFWDHWVPGANEPLEKLCREWAAKEKIELKTDFITSNGDKDLLTVAAEAQSKSGHDILTFTAWYAPGQAENLEPVDDVMAELIRQHGAVSAGAEYLGHWVAVPTSFGSTLSPPCGRIDLMKQIVGLDVTKMYPALNQGRRLETAVAYYRPPLRNTENRQARRHEVDYGIYTWTSGGEWRRGKRNGWDASTGASFEPQSQLPSTRVLFVTRRHRP
jgi:hypothetical protein